MLDWIQQNYHSIVGMGAIIWTAVEPAALIILIALATRLLKTLKQLNQTLNKLKKPETP